MLRVISIHKVMIAIFSVLLLVGCAAQTPKLSPSAAMGKYQSVNDLNAQLDRARQAGIRHLAPTGYQEALMLYNSALDKAMAQDEEAENTRPKRFETLAHCNGAGRWKQSTYA